jgi:MYXO-CTERM domain-containing protein
VSIRVEVVGMKLLRVAVALLVAAAGVLIGAPPALAGNWVVTILDPVPDRFEAGRGYTIGFWALQHGSHPYAGTFEIIGLRLVDATGSTLTFPATALPEAAHYATTVRVPAAGTWTVYGVHKPFQDYRIGTLTVPGGLTVLPIPEPASIEPAGQPWGEIRPPAVPVDNDRGPFDDEAATIVGPTAQPSATTAAAQPASDDESPAPMMLAILAATALLLGLVFAHRRRRTPPRPTSAAPDRLDMRVDEAFDAASEGEPVELTARP